MEEEVKEQKQAKYRRIAVGATVAGVLVVVFLLIVLIVQFVQMGVLNSEHRAIENGIGEYQQKIENQEGVLEEYFSGDALYWQAVKQGWKKK